MNEGALVFGGILWEFELAEGVIGNPYIPSIKTMELGGLFFLEILLGFLTGCNFLVGA